jgi:GCK domain
VALALVRWHSPTGESKCSYIAAHNRQIECFSLTTHSLVLHAVRCCRCVSVAQSNGDDMVQACRIATDALSKCMQTHSDYYGTENEDDEPDSPDQEPVSNAETSKSAAVTKEQP